MNQLSKRLGWWPYYLFVWPWKLLNLSVSVSSPANQEYLVLILGLLGRVKHSDKLFSQEPSIQKWLTNAKGTVTYGLAFALVLFTCRVAVSIPFFIGVHYRFGDVTCRVGVHFLSAEAGDCQVLPPQAGLWRGAVQYKQKDVYTEMVSNRIGIIGREIRMTSDQMGLASALCAQHCAMGIKYN